jgi:Cys-tRNA(Pro)/Cys-tRNA(Cys) deacylase
MKKTNAARRLDAAGVRYQLVPYEVELDDLSAPTVAAKIGLPVGQVYKTLLVRGARHGPCFAVIPGDRRLDLKALAALRSERKVEAVAMKELQGLTGYVRGAVTVLGAKKAFDVVCDEGIVEHELISVSAGQRGLQLWLAPGDYVAVTDAKLASVIA